MNESEIEAKLYRQDNKTDNLTSISAIMMIIVYVCLCVGVYNDTHCFIDTIKYSAVFP